MPLYEYECAKCGHRFERIQKFSDPLVKRCPSCKTGRVRKLLSAPAVQFKGSGWYVTDYGRKHSSEGSSSREKESKGKGEKESSARDPTSAAGPKKDSGKKD